jgi:hypothetical protein
MKKNVINNGKGRFEKKEAAVLHKNFLFHTLDF